MKAKFADPIESVKGNLSPEYYARMLNGEQIIQRRPKRTKPPTEKQLRQRKWFADNYAGKHE